MPKTLTTYNQTILNWFSDKNMSDLTLEKLQTWFMHVIKLVSDLNLNWFVTWFQIYDSSVAVF